MHTLETQSKGATIRADRNTLHGQLLSPPEPYGLVIFAHGSGSNRHAPRNQRVAECLHDVGLATLLFDLQSPDEAPPDAFNARLWFDIALLAERLRAATRWARSQPELMELPIGYFGASTGGAAAILAASQADGDEIKAVVTRGGRPDLAGDAIRQLRAPTLLLVGGNDEGAAALNLEAWARLRCERGIEIIPGAGHFFEEPGALENVAALATRWFGEHLRKNGDRLA